MSSNADHYFALAEENARAAAATDLPNVKERCLRAEAAWREMAERLVRMAENREQYAAVRAARMLEAE